MNSYSTQQGSTVLDFTFWQTWGLNAFSGVIALCIILLLVSKVLHGSKPRYLAKEILTRNELEFFIRIRKAAPDLYIFPQVAMSALLEPNEKSQKKWLYSFNRIAQKRIDYGLYSENMRLLAIIELDDKTHDKAKDQIRDSYTKSAGIKTLRFESKAKPTINELRLVINECIN